MGAFERWKRNEQARENAGKPLGGGLDPVAAPTHGRASIGNLRVEKPVEAAGERGLRVLFVLHADELGQARLIAETTLHEQGRGPFKSSVPKLADTQGALNVFEIVSPPSDAPFATELAAFVPFSAIAAEHPGKLKCFARVRVLEAERGLLCEEETAFQLDAG